MTGHRYTEFRILDITKDGIMDKFIMHIFRLLIYLNFIVILWMAVSDITNKKYCAKTT